ncbi:MAG: carboxypeptidase-like regulatory domain-containing protein [Gemmatimonadetes bacterium]|nr:carboxypeptidase-like regulatory domain-containing protein [Gemmatimonadota bacterium]
MTWTAIPSERTVLYSQIGLRLVDEFSGGPSQYPVAALLSYQDSAGDWQPTSIKPTPTPSGNLSFPGLGRSANLPAAVMVRHRVQLASEFYRPEYLRTLDALEFDIHPYDDDQPPAVVPNVPQTVLLLPSAVYPHAAFVRTVRGQTLDTSGDPIVNVEVTAGTSERVLSDERGVFSLPLRWAPLSGNVVIDAIDHRTGRTDQINLALPQDLLQGQTFTLT